MKNTSFHSTVWKILVGMMCRIVSVIVIYFCVFYYFVFVWRFAILFYSSCKISESELYIRVINSCPSENIQCDGKKTLEAFYAEKE